MPQILEKCSEKSYIVAVCKAVLTFPVLSPSSLVDLISYNLSTPWKIYLARSVILHQIAGYGSADAIVDIYYVGKVKEVGLVCIRNPEISHMLLTL